MVRVWVDSASKVQGLHSGVCQAWHSTASCGWDAHYWGAFVVGDTLAVREDVDVCAFGTEFAVSLLRPG